MKVLKYKTLTRSTVGQLDTIVEHYIQLDWELYGPQYYNGLYFIQVVILKEENEN